MKEEPVTWGVDWGKAGQAPCVSIIKRLPDGGIEVVAVEYGPEPDYISSTERMFADTFHQVVRNQTLEEVAREFDKMKSLGDTAASFAAYVRNMKK